MDELASSSKWKLVIGRTEDDDYREDGDGRADYVDACWERIKARAAAGPGTCQDG